MSTTTAPNNPQSPCRYCAMFSVGTPAADEVVCGCEADCGAARCLAAGPPPGRAYADHQRFLATQAEHQPEHQPDVSTDSPADPYGPSLRDPSLDRVRRWQPHPGAVRHARALLAAEPQADLAVIPMFQPGKSRSWWTSGQPVHTVFGVVLLSQNTFTPTGHIPSHSWARDTAATIATERLHAFAAQHPDLCADDGGIGTVAWATVRRHNTDTPVFEEIMPIRRAEFPRWEQVAEPYADGTDPLERWLVTFIVGEDENPGGELVPIGVTSPAEAAAAALRLTQDQQAGSTVWHVFDRKTGEVHRYEQSEFEQTDVGDLIADILHDQETQGP